MAKALKHQFRMYGNNKLSFNFQGVINVRGHKLYPDKIIIFFDDIFQIKYKCFLYKCLNPIYKK